MQELISMIVPVYNAGQYIVPCLESLTSQTYQNIEIILVDDGSTDDSLRICNEYAAKNPCIRVLHQENQGVSAARNAGLSCAKGEYVAFVDADDYVKPDYLEILAADANAHSADIVCCNFIEILNGRQVHLNTDKVLSARMIRSRAELVSDFIIGKEAYGTCVWAKLIRTDLAKKVTFRPLKFGEDTEYMFRLFLLSPSVYLDMYQGYYYIRNESSATMKNDEKSVSRCMDELKLAEQLMALVPEDCADSYPGFYNRYVATIHALAAATVLSRNKEHYQKYRTDIRARIHAVFQSGVQITAKLKLFLRLYDSVPWLYKWLLQIKQMLVK